MFDSFASYNERVVYNVQRARDFFEQVLFYNEQYDNQMDELRKLRNKEEFQFLKRSTNGFNSSVSTSVDVTRTAFSRRLSKDFDTPSTITIQKGKAERLQDDISSCGPFSIYFLRIIAEYIEKSGDPQRPNWNELFDSARGRSVALYYIQHVRECIWNAIMLESTDTNGNQAPQERSQEFHNTIVSYNAGGFGKRQAIDIIDDDLFYLPNSVYNAVDDLSSIGSEDNLDQPSWMNTKVKLLSSDEDYDELNDD
jgi:hypothetical protein